MKKGLSQMYVSLIENMYEGTSTRLRCLCGETEDFSVKIGVHQGLALYSDLFL